MCDEGMQKSDNDWAVIAGEHNDTSSRKLIKIKQAMELSAWTANNETFNRTKSLEGEQFSRLQDLIRVVT